MVLPWALAASSPEGRDDKETRPDLSLRARPRISFSPARVFLTAELRGGADDYEEFYCAAVEWDWGDGTKSKSTYDCEPYEQGKSEIRRRYAIEHVFRRSGNYKVQFKLKRDDDVVGLANTTIQVRPGLREIR